jgi:glyoxylase-like metal-dependent hydrolase (beta-lactamase superfamily II)
MSNSVNRISRYGGFVNAFLVVEDDGLTLIDTTTPRGGKKILAGAAKLDAPIVRVALTHAHGDHIGSLDEVADALPGVEVIISAREARFLDKDMSLDPGEPEDELRGGWPGARTRPTRTVQPGDMIGSLEVIASPGHTPGHVAFLDRRDGTLYAGDALSTLGGMATPAKPRRVFPLVASATWHKPLALDSARALRALDPARLATGHGKVVESPGPAMDAAIARSS